MSEQDKAGETPAMIPIARFNEVNEKYKQASDKLATVEAAHAAALSAATQGWQQKESAYQAKESLLTESMELVRSGIVDDAGIATARVLYNATPTDKRPPIGDWLKNDPIATKALAGFRTAPPAAIVATTGTPATAAAVVPAATNGANPNAGAKDPGPTASYESLQARLAQLSPTRDNAEYRKVAAEMAKFPKQRK